MGYLEDLRQEELEGLQKVKAVLDETVFFGAFDDAYQYLTYHLKSNAIASKTLMIRGKPGCGKRTLMREIETDCLRDVAVIHLSPFQHTDDYATIRYIGRELGFKCDNTISDVLSSLENYKRKLVIVLWDFEVFCRQKQGLLYNLTDLCQKGNDISLIAMTNSLDATENLEKRVRSRLNTIYYEMTYPYRNKQEYLDFASLLVGDQKFSDPLKEQLTFMWNSTSRSVRVLKDYLMKLCEWDDGVLVVNLPDPGAGVLPHSDVELLLRKLNYLTRPQLDLLKVAVSFCCSDNGPAADFNLLALADYVRQRGFHSFDATSPLAYKNLRILAKVSLVLALKPDQPLNQFSKFTIGVMPAHLRRVLELAPEHQSMATDALWRKMN